MALQPHLPRRRERAGPWRDELVRAYPTLREWSPHVVATFDDLLVDWNFRRWEATTEGT